MGGSGGEGILLMRSANHWAQALGVLKLVGRCSVVLRIILIAVVMPTIPVLMFVTRIPAWELWV